MHRQRLIAGVLALVVVVIVCAFAFGMLPL